MRTLPSASTAMCVIENGLFWSTAPPRIVDVLNRLPRQVRCAADGSRGSPASSNQAKSMPFVDVGPVCSAMKASVVMSRSSTRVPVNLSWAISATVPEAIRYRAAGNQVGRRTDPAAVGQTDPSSFTRQKPTPLQSSVEPDPHPVAICIDLVGNPRPIRVQPSSTCLGARDRSSHRYQRAA